MTRMRRPGRQRGLALVEFALVASGGFILLLLGVFELSRVMYTFNTANEATRLGARLAVVCGMNDTVITDRMSALLPELNASTVSITYEPSGCQADAVDDTPACQSATVAINPGTTIQTVIPFIDFTIDIPPFSTTLTREAMDSSNCT